MPPYGEPDYKFAGGDIPVLVIAPHATAFWREEPEAELIYWLYVLFT